jgi:hypothetical protein
VREERFVAQNQFSCCVDKRPESILVMIHSCWICGSRLFH